MSKSSTSTDAKPSKVDIRKLVVKNTTERLVTELNKAQTVLTVEQIRALPRPLLVRNVIQLRFGTGQTGVVQTVQTDFVPVTDMTDSDDDDDEVFVAEQQQKRIAAAVVAPVAVAATAQPAQDGMTQLLLQMHLQHQQQLAAMQMQAATLQAASDERANALQRQMAIDKLASEERTAAYEARTAVLQAASDERASQDRQLMAAQFKQQHDAQYNLTKAETDRRLHDSLLFENRVAKATKLTKNLLYQMPNFASEIPAYLSNVDQVFDDQKIDLDMRVTLLTPYLNPRIRNVMTSVPAEDKQDYEKFKTRILKEYALNPTTLKSNFDNARRFNESPIQFVTRLSRLFAAWIDSKKIKTFEALVKLLVLDRYKNSLSESLRMYLADKELTEVDMTPDRAAEIIDAREASWGKQNWGKPQFTSFADKRRTESSRPVAQGAEGNSKFQYRQNCDKGQNSQPYLGADRSRIQCYKCGGRGHLANTCSVDKPKPAKVRYVSRNGTYNRSWSGTKNGSNGRGGFGHSSEDSSRSANSANAKTYDTKRVATAPLSLQKEYQPIHCNLVNLKVKDELPVGYPDRFIQVDFGAGEVSALCDSGCEISVLKPSMLAPGAVKPSGQIALQGAFHSQILAQMCNVNAQVVSPTAVPVTLTVAVTENLKGDVALLTVDDFQTLKRMSNARPNTEYLSNTPYLYTDPLLLNDEDQCRRAEICAVTSKDRGNLKVSDEDNRPFLHDRVANDCTSHEDFSKMQKDDVSLKECWEEVDKPDTLFFQDKGYLFRRGTVGNIVVKQLVIPEEKREQLIRHGHDSLYAMHFAKKKTIARLASYFWWPRMASQVEIYIAKCEPCQMHARKKKLDRVPITPIPLAAEAWQVVQIDVVGPIEPASSGGHRYILCMICLNTRWCEAVPLRTLSAREATTALVHLFMHCQIPSSIICDQATYFTAALSQELFERIGVEIHYSTPGHAEGHGAIERFNGTLQNMLHHVINSDKPREWHTKLPYLLWAYREIPHETTKCSPVSLMYGLAPRGPLAVLRDTWSDRDTPVAKLDKNAQEYLAKLREDIKSMHEIAVESATKQQKAYTDNYNLQAREKQFKIDDNVLILTPTSTNKLKSRWLGPGTVVKVLDAHSYSVATPDGAVRVLHANQLRPFMARVDAIGVVYEQDEDFGQLETYPTQGDITDFETKLDAVVVDHLSQSQKGELFSVLRRHSAVFNDKPGRCRVGVAELQTKPDHEFIIQKPYRIPEKLKPEIEKQIAELLADGRIQRATSEFTHPVVAVSKQGGGIRLCVDFRCVNRGLIPSRYPVPRCDELIREIQPAKFISSLDCSAAFWSIPIRDEDQHKTGFVVNNQQFIWKCLPFGIATASQIFQKCIDTALRKHSDIAKAYIDDTFIRTLQDSFPLHLQHLDRVLQAFADAGFTIKLSKCQFAKSQIAYVGFLVGSGSIKPLSDKLDVIRNVPIPTTKKAVRSFLGMCNFFRSHSGNYAEIACPLIELTKSSVRTKIRMNSDQIAAFNALKEELCKATELHTPDYELPFQMYVDSSDHTVGAALAQYDNQHILRPVAFASQKLNQTQLAWPVIHKEAYSVVFGLTSFEHFIHGCFIEIMSDHNPLLGIVDKSPLVPKLIRWSLTINRFNFKLTHIPGKDNFLGDFLSRYTQ